MSDKATILIVDDEEDFCQTVSDILSHSGYETITKQNPVEALQYLQGNPVDLVLLDILMPQMDGRQVLTEIVGSWPEIPVIMITGQAYNVPVAVETSKKGSFSFLAKPIDLLELTESVKRALEQRQPGVKSDTLERVMRDLGMVSLSRKFLSTLAMAERVAPTTVPVLITGESGVGKEMVARAIHHMSPRAARRFVAVDCGALTETLLESELFGHAKGAFTGATGEKKGLFEAADGGTIFLDEIANTSLTFQQKLLRVLNNGTFFRVGSTAEITVNVRVISATNKDIEQAITRGEFRDDLYYRINKYDIHVPPLRERPEDVPVIVTHLLARARREHEIVPHVFSPAALDLLSKQEWKGNVRQLDSIVTKLAIVAEAEEIDVHTVAHALRATAPDPTGAGDKRPLMDQVEEFEKKLIIEALRANGGNQTKAAEQLGVERTNFVKKMRKHELHGKDYS